MKTLKIVAAIGATVLAMAMQPAFAQTGDSKADPRSRAQGPTDNPNTSANPVGSPNSTNANRCAGMTGKAHDDCMSNMGATKSKDAKRSAKRERSEARKEARAERRAASGSTTRNTTKSGATGTGTNEGRGVTQNENTSQNPNTGGSSVNRGGDSNMKSAK
jgi:hypothetical protein